MIIKIPRCYDSHIHFQATGFVQSGLKLSHLKSASDLESLQAEPWHFRGEWLTGFGWDENKWPTKKIPTKEDLDQKFPDFPVAFVRADGHAVWLNSKALERIGYVTEKPASMKEIDDRLVGKDQKGHPTGVFKEIAKIFVDGFIPPPSLEQEKQFLISAQTYFNQRGFTHVRDMTGFISQWSLLQEMDQKKALTVYLDENFTCENLSDFDRALQEVQIAKSSQTPHLKARGIKFYFDGSLGSETAFLSQNYSGHHDNRGLTLWPMEHIKEVLIRTWEKGLEVSAHTIGDEAAHWIAKAAHGVHHDRVKGVINFEHAEILRPETIAIIQDLNARVHLQPCHWHSDQRWLKEKIPGLYESVFPWAALQKAQVPIYFGSDSPIEEASIYSNSEALRLSEKEGIPGVGSEWWKLHSHFESSWGADCWSEFENEKVLRVVFDGEPLL